MVTRTQLAELTNTKTLWMVVKKQRLLAVNFIFICNLKFEWRICYTEIKNSLQFTNVRKSHRQPRCPLQLVCEDRVFFVWVDLHVSIRGHQHPKCEWAVRLVYPPFYFNATPHYKRVVSPYNTYKDVNTSGNMVECENTECDCICALPRIVRHRLPRYTASCIRRTTSSTTPLRKYQNLQVFTNTKGIQKRKFLRKIFRHLSDSVQRVVHVYYILSQVYARH